ncbi:MAG: TIR domain-containing protein [Cyanobacteriota bacterium]
MAADAQNSPKPLVYVSYAWGDETDAGREREQIVDELCQALEKYDDIIVGRDKRRQKIGDSIEGFAADISKAEIILAVISKKYLRSYHCMVEELYQAYCRSFSRKEEFNKKVCLLLLDDAIDDINVSQELIDHWLDFEQELNSKLLQIDPNKNSRYGWESLKHIQAMKSLMIDMLSALTDSVMPRGYKQIKRNDFQELRDLIRRRLIEWYQWRDDRSGFIPEIEESSANGSQFEDNDLKQQFLALVLERGQKLIDDPKWAEKECPWEVSNYKWESLLFNTQQGRYLTVDLQADIGSYLVAKQTVNNSLSTATECSTFGDLLQAAVSWINKHSSACVLELFVPTELLLFDWSAIKIPGRSEYDDDECLYEQHPYVLRSLDRFSDANLSSRLKQMPLKYRALAAGNGRWIAGDSAVSRTMLKESETKPEFVALKCISHLDTDPLNRLRWHRSVVEAMMPLALWWRDHQENCQDDFTSHLDLFYKGLLSGHNDADPVPKDCHHLEKLPCLRREAISQPLTKDLVLLLDRPDRHPWAHSSLPHGSSNRSV